MSGSQGEGLGRADGGLGFTKGHGALNRLHAPVGLKGNLSAAVGLKQAQRGGHGHAYGCQGGQAVRAVTLVHGVSMELVRGSPSGENKGEPGRCM